MTEGGGTTGGRASRSRVLAAAGATCLAAALAFVAADPTASGYEITVYDSYPTAFWVLLLAALFFGQAVVFESARGVGGSNDWKLGFGLLLAANGVLLFLPAVRYDVWARGDLLTFVGMITDVGALGAVGPSNYYPNAHLLALVFSWATGVPVADVVNLLPPVMTLVYVVGTYVFLTVACDDARKPLYVLPFSSLLLYKFENLWFTPSVFAFMLVPLVLYLVFRGRTERARTRFRFLLLVGIVALVFYHPAVTIFLVGILGVVTLAFRFRGALDAGRSRHSSTPIIAASIAFVVFFAWYYSFDSIVGSTLIVVYNLLGLSQGSPQFGQITSVYARTTPQLSDVVLVGIYSYGLFAALVGMASVFVGYFGYLALRGRRSFGTLEAILAGVLAVFTVGGAFAFFVDVTLGFTRIVRYARFAGSILVGFGFYVLFRRVDGRTATRYLRPAAYVSFFVFAFLSTFMLYGSPVSNEPNIQLTDGEIDGMAWLFDHRNESLLVDELGVSQYRHHTMTSPRADLGETLRQSGPPPDHFAYGNASAVSRPDEDWTLRDRRYLVITELGRTENPRFYPQYPEFWRHAPADFARLERNPDVFRVYDSGTLDTYLVHDVGEGNASTASPGDASASPTLSGSGSAAAGSNPLRASRRPNRYAGH